MVQVKAQSIYLIAYVYHRLYFINGKLSKIKLANKKHALAFMAYARLWRNKINIQFKSSFYGDCRDARQKYLKSDNIYFVNWGTND